ncbi:antitoxin Xre/MbcA/ParS toxin-binding domain-containing protein [Pseudomonas chlororaphis]|uniref:antitoxin Xre/MbcA/ParS toxin-binding domain-containing protein n=1 Tax=Pseudomonas chlororaphis TaxID=587753 RepID=UPI001360B10C|nr:antitoxin Xre/MbcA/ParS toxin-binding domain-containing protein [Pseudomonas chlororaphis]
MHEDLKVAPQPLFGDIPSLSLPLERYFERFPSVKKFLDCFPKNLNCLQDFCWGREYLSRQEHVNLNYRSYVERLLLWSWVFQNKSVLELDRSAFDEFVKFHFSPPETWTGSAAYHRFTLNDGAMKPNPKWRPLYLTEGRTKNTDYIISQDSLTRVVSVCSGFFRFLISRNAISCNPAANIAKLRVPVAQNTGLTTRTLTIDQWDSVVRAAQLMADENPQNERTLFIICSIYYLMLKTSDLEGRLECPMMNIFFEVDGEWWLKLPSASGLPSIISVDAAYLPFLTRYRLSRGLRPLPNPGESVPLLATRGGRPGLCKRQIQAVVKAVLVRAHREMFKAGRAEAECYALLVASADWLRQSGALHLSAKKKPLDLQRDYRCNRLGYLYTRFYGAQEKGKMIMKSDTMGNPPASVLTSEAQKVELYRTPTQYLIHDIQELSNILIYRRIAQGISLKKFRELLAACRGLPSDYILQRIVRITPAQRKSQKNTNLLLSSQQSAAAIHFARALERASSVFGAQPLAEEWLLRPCTYLEGIAPIDMVGNTLGFQAVEAYLDRISYGVYQ